MRFQSNRSSCGPAALSNGLEALGLTRTEEELIRLCKQTQDGTSAQGIIKAIKAISTPEAPLKGIPFQFKDPEDAIVGLWWNVAEHGRPTILCVDNLDHWVCCVGKLGRRFCVVDSADNRLLLHYSAEQLINRWVAENRFYGIIL